MAGESQSLPSQPATAEELSYFYTPRPFKNPNYNKNLNRKQKPAKQVLQAEAQRGVVRLPQSGSSMVVDQSGETLSGSQAFPIGYTTLHPPPSLLPAKKYCDITGLIAPYTDPKSGIRYHSKEVYEIVKTLGPGSDQAYLALRGRGNVIL